MALSSGAANQNATTNRLLNKLNYALSNVAADITTATTSDIVLMLDADDNYEVKYGDKANLAEMMVTTAGTVTASEPVVVDANLDIGDFRNLDAVNIDAGESGTAGTVDVFPSTASKGKLALAAVDNDGDTATTISNAAMGQATVVSIPDPGAATANFVLTDAANDGAVVTATAAEINNAADVSARVEEHTGAGAVTAGVQSVEINSVAAAALTIASADGHEGLFIVKHTSSSDGQNHTLTLTSGTYDGTNTVALLDAANEALVVYFDSSGNGTIVENVGSVSLG